MAEWASPVLGGAMQMLFDRASLREVLNFIRRKPNYLKEQLLKQLQMLFISAKAVRDDAEEEKIMDPIVKELAEKLEDAMDEARKLLDEIAAKASESNSNSIPHTYGDKLKDYFSSANWRLKRSNETLTSLVVELRSVIGFNEGRVRRESSLSLPTTGIPDESEPVYGRDDDKEIIIQNMSSPNVQRAKLSVFVIVGMAGVGKTTLCQHLLNDPKVETFFKLRRWIYVSGRSDVSAPDLIKRVYESVTESTTEIRDLHVLQDKLRLELKDQRFLLVLDDFWSENFDFWDCVKKPLTNGAPGSVLILTTRNENVAHTTASAKVIHTLHPLEFDDCWKIFAHHAFGTRDADENPTLNKIGKKIAEKCDGLPLSAKVLGRLVHPTSDALEWDKILNSKIWNLPADKSNILPSLILSYQHLPLHLKHCFKFCSIFPQGCPIRKWILILLWMAHGLLESKGEKTMEQVGEEYFKELVSRSFLQRSRRNDSDFETDGLHDSDFEMHDLMNDLAQHVGGDRFHKFEGGTLGDIPERVYHLSFLQDKIDHPANLGASRDFSLLKTFLPFRLRYSLSSNSLTQGPFDFLEKGLKSVVVLSLSNYAITKLPGSSKSFKYLKFLNLSETGIKKLPDFVVSLPNLLTLLLSSCICLDQLPTGLPKLTRLRHLDVSGTRLTEMPPKFSTMESLQMLTTYFVSKKNASRVSELGSLTQLCGSLSIVNLQNVSNATEASEAKLKEKKFLRELRLIWTDDGQNPDREKDVLGKLQPHEYLRKLTIESYGGKKFPRWLGSTSFSNMVSVYLTGCRNCESLPPLGQLCNLNTLCITQMTRLEKVNPEFYGDVTPHFKSLTTLSFEDMQTWKEWLPVQGAQFPLLQKLHIRKCPNLTGNLNLQMPLLTSLAILQCKNLQLFPIGHATLQLQVLKHLHLRSSCDTLDCFPLCSFPALCDLHIENCSRLQHLIISPEFQHELGSLKNMVLRDCLNLVSFPNGGLRAPNLNSLRIKNCPTLVQRCKEETGAYWDLISHITHRDIV